AVLGARAAAVAPVWAAAEPAIRRPIATLAARAAIALAPNLRFMSPRFVHVITAGASHSGFLTSVPSRPLPPRPSLLPPERRRGYRPWRGCLHGPHTRTKPLPSCSSAPTRSRAG